MSGEGGGGLPRRVPVSGLCSVCTGCWGGGGEGEIPRPVPVCGLCSVCTGCVGGGGGEGDYPGLFLCLDCVVFVQGVGGGGRGGIPRPVPVSGLCSVCTGCGGGGDTQTCSCVWTVQCLYRVWEGGGGVY